MSNTYMMNEKQFGLVGVEPINYPEMKIVAFFDDVNKIILIWKGKSKKPNTYAKYMNEDHYKNAKKSEINFIESEIKRIAEYEEKAKKRHDDILDNLNVGDVCYVSWGWEQTNIDFYQIVSKKSKSFEFKKLQKNIDYNSHTMQGTCSPKLDCFVSDEIIKLRLNKNGYFKKSSFESLYPAEYKEENGEKIYESKFFSNYA